MSIEPQNNDLQNLEPAAVAPPVEPVARANNRTYLWAAIPPVAFLGLALAFANSPLPQPLNSGPGATTSTSSNGMTVTADGQLLVPASETLIVTRQSASGYVMLSGRMEPPLGATIAAPSNGQVAQVAVRPGQIVQPGQEIVALSTGAVAPPPRDFGPVDNRATQAEAAQAAALRRQRAWQEKVREAHQRLKKAQDRVQAAQVRVAQARELVQRLQNGEEVSAPAESTPAPPPPRRTRSTESRNVAAQREAIVRRSQKLQQDADDALFGFRAYLF